MMKLWHLIRPGSLMLLLLISAAFMSFNGSYTISEAFGMMYWMLMGWIARSLRGDD